MKTFSKQLNELEKLNNKPLDKITKEEQNRIKELITVLNGLG